MSAAWYLAFREERNIKRVKSGAEERKEETGENCVMRGFTICTLHQVHGVGFKTEF
jgi:hypothetical protein